MTTPIYEDQNFYAPHFEIKLRGQNLSRAVVRDVLDVSYRESLDKLDSFEITLNDWDPVNLRPRYSSPFDENSNLLTLEDGSPVPNFEPGAKVELRMGYYGAEEPRLMMTGQVVSLSPQFSHQRHAHAEGARPQPAVYPANGGGRACFREQDGQRDRHGHCQ